VFNSSNIQKQKERKEERERGEGGRKEGRKGKVMSRRVKVYVKNMCVRKVGGTHL
jgi:hypothetical protein